MVRPAPSHIEFPALLDAAERESAEQQRIFFLLTGGQLTGLVLASFASLVPAESAGRAGPIVMLLLLLAVIAIQVSGVATRSEQRWYDARAAAESIKSASWQFAVGGESFRTADAGAAARFTEMLRDVLRGLPSLDIGSASSSNASVTPTMQALRDSDIAERAEIYRRDRVDDQISWYSSNAARSRHLSRRFGIAVVLVELVVVVLGILRVQGAVDIDLLSALVATAAGLVAWTQAKKYTSLAEAYAVTSHEVGLVASSLDARNTEDDWAQSVHDAEAAFSREHTMWRARRQGPKYAGD